MASSLGNFLLLQKTPLFLACRRNFFHSAAKIVGCNYSCSYNKSPLSPLSASTRRVRPRPIWYGWASVLVLTTATASLLTKSASCEDGNELCLSSRKGDKLTVEKVTLLIMP